MDFQYSSISNIGLKRLENEDALGVFNIENGLLAIVCDGLGGNKAGEVASKLAVDTIHHYFRNSAEKDYLKRIKAAIAEANSTIMEASKANFEHKGMATTTEVLYLKDFTAYWGHVGDSRIYYLKNGKIKQLTKDHSLVQKLVDDGFITLKEAETHPNKNIIMRAVGDNDSVTIDLSKLKINPADNQSFFICTDGVTAVLRNNELEDILYGSNLSYITQKLSGLIDLRGAPDNYSFVIISSIE